MTRLLQQGGDIAEQITHELHQHGYRKDQQESRQQIFDVKTIAALRDFETEQRSVDGIRLAPHAHGHDDPAQRQTEKDTADAVGDGFTLAAKPGVQDIDPNMAFLDQRVGAGEQEQCAVPEADQISHERLLVRENEARDDDQQFGTNDQQCQPVESEIAVEIGNDQARDHQRVMNELTAVYRAPQILGQSIAQDVDRETLNPQE